MKKRYIPLWVLAPFVVLFIVLALVISPIGTPALRALVNNAVSGLHINEIDGTIVSDITVRGLSWENEYWQVQASEVSTNVVLGCLLSGKVCLDVVHTDGVKVSQLGVAPASQAPPSTEPFSLPVTIKAPDINLTNTRIALTDQTIELASLDTGISAGDELVVDYLQLQGLTVTMPATEPATQPAPTSYALNYSAPALPAITTPLPVLIKDLSVADTTLWQGESKQHIKLVKLARFEFSDVDMRAESLHVEHAMGVVDASADITLQDKYALDIDAEASINNLGEAAEQVSLSASGSLQDLRLSIAASGPYTAKADLSANLLSDTLPVELTASWPDQTLAALPDGQLYQGQLRASGTMGNYHLTAGTSADIPQIGNVPVKADMILNRNNITVNALTASLLGGRITNTGTLYLNESVSWAGMTKLAGLTSKPLAEMGPEAISGQFKTLMQYDDKGIQASISELSLTAQQGAYPLTVDGSVVYAGPSELLVTNVQVTQGDNRADVAGQVIKNRYLKGTVKLAMQQLDAVYPGLSGALDADIDISGNWQDPGATGQISLNEVKAGPQISPALAAQGALNGTVTLDGRLSSHHFETELAVTDHALSLALDGQWKDARWVGRIQRSNLSLLSTRWALQDGFTVAVRPAPFSTKITQNCWQSRAEGQLCIDDLLYKNDVARWTLNARALPAGLWASEFLAELLPEAPDSTLSISSKGKMPKNGRPQGTFNLALTPATWKLGKEGAVAIDVDKLEVKGNIKNDDLKASMALISPQLGEVTGNLATRPFEENPQLDGMIDVSGIQLEPLKPVSPTIRELSGAFGGQLQLTGQLSAPVMNGQLKLADGNIDIDDTPATITNWNQSIVFEGSQAQFDGSFMLGDGKGSLDGSVDWSEIDTPKVEVHLSGDRLEVEQRDVQVKLSPDLNASIEPGLVKVTGQISIPWARAKIEELPQSAVAPSKDVHLRGEPPTEDPLDIVDAKIDVIIDKDKAGEVKLEAFGLTANLAGELQVATQPAPVGYGSLQVMDGRYQAYGQDLIIQTGEVQFNGPLDQPLLLVEAIRDPSKTDDGVIAGIRIDGAADSPNISIFSTPSMEQGNALGYLLTGSAPNAGGSGDPNYAAILLGMGLSNTDKIQGQLGSALGIDDFSIGTTSGSASDDPKLSLNGRINERLSIQYNVDVGLGKKDSTTETVRRRSAPPDLALKYRWLPQFYVEAIQTTIEEQTEFALDFYYQFFLGEVPEQRKPDAVEKTAEQGD
ncbi:translocation/assembly module TamB domain-containing protein [Salinimonas lutimaris]|uniref:translocation/assembly module TamB domain-containing protein n=1 Tax=Salinimonas lutimaris TaxID=914153 RepID=UPI0010C0A864|nr:translocation/assembly module TamB domain-containing protein [Salinimonas lutimaris]